MAKKKAAKKSGKKKAAKRSGKKASKKNSLVGNINKRKRAGKSRSKKNSTISKDAYEDMQAGWPEKKRKKAVKKSKTKSG